jgi:branched-chain amino acid transport system substrate-binding protein
LLDTNAARIVRTLRDRLARSVELLGPDGLTPLPILAQQGGDAAIGVYVTLPGLVTEGLPRAGVRFVQEFGRTQPGAEVEPSAVYAAQAAIVLLDAIARSDGSRASVLRHLLATRVRNGLLGTFAFDGNGDITESPVTILRVERQGTSATIQNVEGGTVVRVMRPGSRLVRVSQ